jgi:hypothetical protein
MAYRTAGRPADALAALEAAVQVAEQSNERFIEAELHRVTGELMTEVEPTNPAGLTSLEHALGVAAAQGTRSLQLRALIAIEQRHRTCGDGRSTIADIRALLTELDPTGSDPEPLLALARAL